MTATLRRNTRIYHGHFLFPIQGLADLELGFLGLGFLGLGARVVLQRKKMVRSCNYTVLSRQNHPGRAHIVMNSTRFGTESKNGLEQCVRVSAQTE